MRYRRKVEYVEAVRFEGQPIPNLVPSEIWDGEWEIRTANGTTTARIGDYIYLRDGEATGAARPHFFETYYEPAD